MCMLLLLMWVLPETVGCNVLEVNWFFFFFLITGGSLVDTKGSCSSLQGSSRL